MDETSVLYNPFMLSASALSQLSPLRPTEGAMPTSISLSEWCIDTYYEPLSMC